MSLLNFKALKWVRAVVFESLSWHICFFDQCTFQKSMLALVPQSGTDNPSFLVLAHGLIVKFTSLLPFQLRKLLQKIRITLMIKEKNKLNGFAIHAAFLRMDLAQKLESFNLLESLAK